MINKSEAENYSYKKAASFLLGIAAVTVFGYGLYQSVSVAKSDYESYDKFFQECGIFLERAAKAGTTGVAEEELATAVNCLSANYSTQSFEYKNLKGSLNYLEKQTKDLVLPILIKESINQSTNAIKSEKLNQRDESDSILKAIILQMIAIPLIIAAIILKLES